MIIFTLRTDNPDAEIGIYQDNERLAYVSWLAHRELAETIHLKIRDLLQSNAKQIRDIQGIVLFKGPGSFTGLRIGASVANALAYSLQIGIVGSSGKDWLAGGISKLLAGTNDQIVIPEYGSEPNITLPRK